MGRLIITIHDPKKQKLVADALLKISGATLVRVAGSPRKTADGKITRKLTAQERTFVKELRQALEESNGPEP